MRNIFRIMRPKNLAPRLHAFLVPPVLAQTTFSNPIVGDFMGLVCTIVAWVGGVGAVVAFVVIVWSGFQFMTSGGNEQQVSQAKKTLIFALLGFALLIFARALPSILANLAGTPQSDLPQSCQ